MQSLRTNTLRTDNPIRFGSQGNYQTFAPRGFVGDDHPRQTWNDGCVASLLMRILTTADDTRLRIDVDPYIVPGRLPFQTMNVYINGLWIGFLRAENAEQLAIELPGDYLVPTANRLSFVMPNAARPADIGAGNDERRLAFTFREIALVRGT